jgi:RNA-directed DNA polymerase
MKTKVEEIAAKAKKEPKLKFTSLCHHVTKEGIWTSLQRISNKSGVGIDDKDAKEAKETFNQWVDPMLEAVHRQKYKAPPVRRVWIPKPGKTEKRPIGVPCIADRALQRNVTEVLTAIYEQDFLACSFGGRPGLSPHHALCTFDGVVVRKEISWILEADLKNFFGSLNQEWIIKFIKHRIGDPRIIKLIQGWLKAGVLEENCLTASEVGVPQGSSISVLLSNVYLHYVLDLWFEKAIKPRLKGEAYLIRYIDDFVVCFQYQEDALRFETALEKRLDKFGLELERNKTQLVEFGRYAQREAKSSGKKMHSIYLLGFTHYCSQSWKGSFQLERKTEKGRYKRSLAVTKEMLRRERHSKIEDQAREINQKLRGHYGYYGLGGNYNSLHKIYRSTERYWWKMLNSRSRKGKINWEKFKQIQERNRLEKPRLKVPFKEMRKMVVL